MADLSPGEKQRVEILRSLLRGVQVLILDEPTSVLTPQEVEGLFRVMRELRQGGKSLMSFKTTYTSSEAREAAIASGGADGMEPCYVNLDEMFAGVK